MVDIRCRRTHLLLHRGRSECRLCVRYIPTFDFDILRCCPRIVRCYRLPVIQSFLVVCFWSFIKFSTPKISRNVGSYDATRNRFVSCSSSYKDLKIPDRNEWSKSPDTTIKYRSVALWRIMQTTDWHRIVAKISDTDGNEETRGNSDTTSILLSRVLWLILSCYIHCVVTYSVPITTRMTLERNRPVLTLTHSFLLPIGFLLWYHTTIALTGHCVRKIYMYYLYWENYRVRPYFKDTLK